MTIYQSEKSGLVLYQGRFYRLDDELRLWPRYIVASGRDGVVMQDDEGNRKRIEREPIENFIKRVL